MLTPAQWDVVHEDDWGILEDWLADGSLSPEVCRELCFATARHDAGECLRLLLRAKVVDLETRQGALFSAIYRRAFIAMHLLLQSGCDVNYCYRMGTPLHCALLLELDYGIHLEDLTRIMTGMMVLRHITQGIELLLKYNPDPTIVVEGRTPRELALELRQFAAADLLAAYEQRYAASGGHP